MAVSGSKIVDLAEKELGDPYVFGAEGPNSFDCSGLIEYVFKHVGIRTPRVAADQAHFGKPIARANIQPGDLIFFNWSGHGRAEHAGIYAGNGYMIHAPHTGTVVKKVKLNSYYWANEIAIRRFPGVVGGPDSSETADAAQAAADAAAGAVTGAVGGSGGGGGITGAIRGVGAELGKVASGVASVGKVAELVTRAFMPSNLLRGFAAVIGTLFILMGVWFLSREARN